MPKISRTTFPDTLSILPEWEHFDTTSLGDCAFIGCAGFEERCSRALIGSINCIRSALILQYEHNKEDNALQEAAIKGLLDSNGVPTETARVDINLVSSISSWLTKNIYSQIIVDISSMASFAFFPVFSSLFNRSGINSLTVVYTSAELYQPTRDEFEIFFNDMKSGDHHVRPEICAKYNIQSAGIDRNYLFNEFQGDRENRPGHVIVLPNFSYDRVMGMMNYCHGLGASDDDVEYLIGSPAREDHRWITSALSRLYECPPDKSRVVGSLDYKLVMGVLREVWEKNKNNKSLFIADLGSKAHHLGVFLFLLTHGEVGLVLSEPRKFSGASYSKGFTTTRAIRFQNIRELIKRLEKWKTLDFIW